MNEQDSKLWEQYHAAPTAENRNALISRYIDEVTHIAKKIFRSLPHGAGLDEGDLTQDGVFGLAKAITSFDSARGIKFETYLSGRVRGEILDQIRLRDFCPRLVRTRSTKVEKASTLFYAQHGFYPTSEQVVDGFGLPPEMRENAIEDSRSRALVSTNTVVSGEQTIEGSLVDKAEGPEARLDSKDFREAVVRGLDARERFITAEYYFNGRSQASIGSELGLSESCIGLIRRALEPRLRRRAIKCLGLQN